MTATLDIILTTSTAAWLLLCSDSITPSNIPKLLIPEQAILAVSLEFAEQF